MREPVPPKLSDRTSKDHVQAVQRACRILQAFHAEGEVLRVRDLVLRTGLHKATDSRLLRTLEAEGFVERLGDDRFRSRVRAPFQTAVSALVSRRVVWIQPSPGL